MKANDLSGQRAYLIKYTLPTVGGWTAVVIAPSVALAIWTLTRQKVKADVISCNEIETHFIFAFDE